MSGYVTRLQSTLSKMVIARATTTTQRSIVHSWKQVFLRFDGFHNLAAAA